MRDVAGKGPITRHFKKGLTTDTIGGYLASVEGLHQLLKVSASHTVAIHCAHRSIDSRSRVRHHARAVFWSRDRRNE